MTISQDSPLRQKHCVRVECIQPEHREDFREMTVYHYTSPEAFRAIVQKRTLRFTDIRFLNDKSESTYFVEMLAEFLEQHGKEYPRFQDCFRHMLNGRTPQEISNVYDEAFLVGRDGDELLCMQPRCFVFSTCTQNDCLNMWNYYVNNNAYQGYNIGFKAGNLLNTFLANPEDPLLANVQVKYGRVVYRKEEQFRLLEEMLGQVEQKLDWFERFEESAEEAAAWNQWLIQREIDAYAAFFKHPAFEAENEFRIAVVVESNDLPQQTRSDKYATKDTKTILEGFTTKRGLIVPYVQITLPHNSITTVTVAPIMEFELAKRGVRELMRGAEIPGVKVLQSEIPIRF